MSVGATLQSFVASQVERHFQCKFSEILKLPLETISKRQPQPPQAPVSTQVTKEGEGSSSESEHWLSEATRLPPLQPSQNLAAVSPESSTLARRSIQTATCKVQHLHAELKAYAETIVRDALDTLKQEEEEKLEKEMHAKASSFEDSSEESTEASGAAIRAVCSSSDYGGFRSQLWKAGGKTAQPKRWEGELSGPGLSKASRKENPR